MTAVSSDDLITYFTSISNTNEWAKYLEDVDVRGKAEALHDAMLNFSDTNVTAGHVENGKKALKIVVVGDGSVGKTCLLLAYSRGEIPQAYVPTVFENFSHQIQYKNDEYILHLWDTAGQEEYDRLRPLSYADSDVVLLCFAVNNRISFDNIISKWEPEIKHYIPAAKTILVGLKTDLREGTADSVSQQEGDDLAKKLECQCYLEASSVKRTGLEPVFENAVDCIFANQPATTGTSNSTQKQEAKPEKKKTCILQ